MTIYNAERSALFTQTFLILLVFRSSKGLDRSSCWISTSRKDPNLLRSCRTC